MQRPRRLRKGSQRVAGVHSPAGRWGRCDDTVVLSTFVIVISYNKGTPFINQISIFGSIVVSISACHSKEQLAGGRGSIPRQRDTFFLRFRNPEPSFWAPTPFYHETLHIKGLFCLLFLRSTLSLPTTSYSNLLKLPQSLRLCIVFYIPVCNYPLYHNPAYHRTALIIMPSLRACQKDISLPFFAL
jgi:hypothetical protein